MSLLLWALAVMALGLLALALSPRLRKSAFIWTTYLTITGWYYFRVLHKKYAGAANKDAPASSPRSAKRAPLSSSAKTAEPPQDPDLVYFESREVVARRQQELSERLERSGVSERSSHMSESGSSSGSDVSGMPRKRGLFHSRRKAAADEAMRRVSDSSANDLLTSSNVSEEPGTPGRNSSTRRTYVGRKKPTSWAD